ncbi:MAG: hypothetical protein Q9166_004854 [cf. Caloplaca sp. 2 TL-2023]
MALNHVLRISRTDSTGDYVLLNTSSNGSSPLDLQLFATEGTDPYKKSFKHSRISKYRAKSNHLSESQWETLLRAIFLQERPQKSQEPDITDSEKEDLLKDLELVASISNAKLTITFRKSISGIHQKLGEVSLSKDPNAAINVLDWTSTAILRAESLESEAGVLQQKLVEQTTIVQKLNQQLEELILAKKEHEDALLEKCAILINEKKAKIRDQQRLLATAKVDPKKLKEVRAARRSSTSAQRSPKPSGKGKRKASAPASSEDEDDGFENHEVKAEENMEEQQPDSEDVTPGHSDLDETEDEVDSADLDSVPAPPTAKGKVTEKALVNGGASGDGALSEDEEMELPPKRGLPFRKDDGDEKQAAGDRDEGQDTRMADDDETDDDEL